MQPPIQGHVQTHIFIYYCQDVANEKALLQIPSTGLKIQSKSHNIVVAMQVVDRLLKKFHLFHNHKELFIGGMLGRITKDFH